MEFASALLRAAHPDSIPLCQLAQSTLVLLGSRITTLASPSLAPPSSIISPARAGSVTQCGLESILQLLRDLFTVMAEVGILAVVAEAVVVSLIDAVTALTNLKARQTSGVAAAAGAAAAMLADLVTGFPTLLDQNPGVLLRLSCSAGQGESVTRCMRAYLACLPQTVLESQLLAAAAKLHPVTSVQDLEVLHCQDSLPLTAPYAFIASLDESF